MRFTVQPCRPLVKHRSMISLPVKTTLPDPIIEMTAGFTIYIRLLCIKISMKKC